MQNYIGLHKTKLNTPALIIDKTQLLKNIQLMQNFAKTKNINVRPHAKTHKCSKIAKLQIDAGAIGICVTKISEAYELIKNDIKNILITSPVIAENKIEILIELLNKAPDTMLVIDNLTNAEQLNKSLIKNNLMLNVLLDIDGGIGRTGVKFEDAIGLAIAINQLSNIVVKGIQCYAGHIQHIQEMKIRAKVSSDILNHAGKIKQMLINHGIECNIQTGSGTGTYSMDADISTVSEMQPGSYVVMDQEYFNIENKHNFAPAMTILATVISTNNDTHVTVDVGTKAMYKTDTRPKIISHNNLEYDWSGYGDEHGKITAISGAKLPILGEVIELIVGHCDPTINLFDKFYITENDIVIDCWDIDLRGKCQ